MSRLAGTGNKRGGMRSIVSACYLLLAVLAISGVKGHEEHQEVANHEVTLKEVCANRQMPIISVEVVRRLIAELDNNPGDCQVNYRQSFYELEPILVTDTDSPLCSEQKFNQIKEYHFRYINPLVESYTFGEDLNKVGKKIVKRPLHEGKFDYTVQLDDYKQEILIPIALSQFFKAWALQVSGMCKRALVDNLDKAMQLMSDVDMELLEGKALEASSDTLNNVGQLSTSEEAAAAAAAAAADESAAGAKSSLLSLFNGSKSKAKKGAASEDNHGKHAFQYGLSFQKLVYLPELEGELEKGDTERRQTVKVLDLRSKPELNKFMHACERRFRPIYSKLVMPIVRLAKLGYEYVGPAIDDIRPRLYQDPQVAKWMLVTMVCESQGRIELVESTEDGAADHLSLGPQLEYAPLYNYKIDNELWVKGSEALRKEFARLSGEQSTGFKKFLYQTGIAGRKAVAFIDPHQFAWYRRNQNTLSSVLNTLSIGSNIASMSLSG